MNSQIRGALTAVDLFGDSTRAPNHRLVGESSARRVRSGATRASSRPARRLLKKYSGPPPVLSHGYPGCHASSS